MIVPQYWAEGRIRQRTSNRQVTARRFGWSDLSQAQAQTHADGRAQQALQRILANEKINRRELKLPYNGAEGIPIREEIISRHGQTIITRNSYGARCLNSPNVLFADIDFQVEPPFRWQFNTFVLLFISSIAAMQIIPLRPPGFAWILLALVFSASLCGIIASRIYRLVADFRGGPLKIARSRIQRFLTQHPDWNFRLYQTPAGLRVLATQQTFLPSDPIVATCFHALGTDRIYAAMCFNQQCFRARALGPFRRNGCRFVRLGSLRMKPRPNRLPLAHFSNRSAAELPIPSYSPSNFCTTHSVKPTRLFPSLNL